MSHAYTFATTKDTGSIALQMALYVIAMHVNVETGKTYCGIKTLMREARVRSDRTMRNYIKQLEDRGLIKREKRFRANGGKSSDLIELVGFLEWRARDGITPPQVAGAAARITGGGPTASQPAFVRQDLPEGSGILLTGASGSLATGECYQSSNTNFNKDDAQAREGTDAQVLPFASTTLQELYALGCDLDALIKRYQSRTKGRRIKDPSAYLLRMGREEIAKATGVTADEVKACSARNRGERQTNLAIVGGAYSNPDPIRVARSRRTRGNVAVDQALAALSTRQFPTQAAVDRAFDAELSNAVLRARTPTVEAAE